MYNQGFKEDTFIQTRRKGGIMEIGGEVVWHREAAALEVGQTVPHSHMVDKNHGSEGSQLQARQPRLPALGR